MKPFGGRLFPNMRLFVRDETEKTVVRVGVRELR